MNAIRAGVLYFLLVFAVGFVLGAARTLVVAPRVGEIYAVLIELPLILCAAWFISGRLVRKFSIASHLSARAIMGSVAFVLLLIAELLLSVWLFGSSVDTHLDGRRSAHGAIGLLGQVIFACLPAIQLVQPGRRRP